MEGVYILILSVFILGLLWISVIKRVPGGQMLVVEKRTENDVNSISKVLLNGYACVIPFLHKVHFINLKPHVFDSKANYVSKDNTVFALSKLITLEISKFTEVAKNYILYFSNRNEKEIDIVIEECLEASLASLFLEMTDNDIKNMIYHDDYDRLYSELNPVFSPFGLHVTGVRIRK